jgi:hypothetical protein
MPKRLVIHIRVSDVEFSVLTLAAQQRGITVSELVRERVFHRDTTPTAEPAQSGRRQRARPASTIRQIQDVTHETVRRDAAHPANELGLPSAPLANVANVQRLDGPADHHPACKCLTCVPPRRERA